MNENKLSKIGIVLGFVCILISLFINIQMAQEYYELNPKERLFISLWRLDRYFYAIIGFIGLIIGFIADNRKEDRKYCSFAIAISFVSILFTFISWWYFMI